VSYVVFKKNQWSLPTAVVALVSALLLVSVLGWQAIRGAVARAAGAEQAARSAEAHAIEAQAAASEAVSALRAERQVARPTSSPVQSAERPLELSDGVAWDLDAWTAGTEEADLETSVSGQYVAARGEARLALLDPGPASTVPGRCAAARRAGERESVFLGDLAAGGGLCVFSRSGRLFLLQPEGTPGTFTVTAW
jgi:cytoskeletal protein RodZ